MQDLTVTWHDLHALYPQATGASILPTKFYYVLFFDIRTMNILQFPRQELISDIQERKLWAVYWSTCM